jgi:hypothetical protein
MAVYSEMDRIWHVHADKDFPERRVALTACTVGVLKNFAHLRLRRGKFKILLIRKLIANKALTLQ